jgi:hypothetical protein
VGIGPATIQETGKDLVTKAAQVAQVRLRPWRRVLARAVPRL